MWIKSHYLNISPPPNLNWQCQNVPITRKHFVKNWSNVSQQVNSWLLAHLVGADKGAATVTRARPSTLEHFEMQSLLCECILGVAFGCTVNCRAAHLWRLSIDNRHKLKYFGK